MELQKIQFSLLSTKEVYIVSSGVSPVSFGSIQTFFLSTQDITKFLAKLREIPRTDSGLMNGSPAPCLAGACTRPLLFRSVFHETQTSEVMFLITQLATSAFLYAVSSRTPLSFWASPEVL